MFNKLKIISLSLIVLIVFIMKISFASEDNLIPSWVPREAITVAKEGLGYFVDYAIGFGSTYTKEKLSKKDFKGIYIKHAYEVISVDYKNYDHGPIIKHFFKPGTMSRCIGFGVYIEDKFIGIIEARKYKTGDWRHYVKTYCGLDGAYDRLKCLFDTYPAYKGYKIYKNFLVDEYFVEGNGRIIDFVITSDNKCIHYDPISRMVKMREKIRKYLKHREERKMYDEKKKE